MELDCTILLIIGITLMVIGIAKGDSDRYG